MMKERMVENGIRGVLRKTDDRYAGIKRVYNEVHSDRQTYS